MTRAALLRHRAFECEARARSLIDRATLQPADEARQLLQWADLEVTVARVLEEIAQVEDEAGE